MTMRRLLLSFRGRIARTAFWWSGIWLGLAFLVLFVFLQAVAGYGATLLLYPPLFWIGAALAVKRLHDRAKPAWWLLVLLVPVLGPLWLFIDLGLRRGTPGENPYGPDPLEPAGDYMTVR